MPDFVVRNIPVGTYKRLQKNARQHKRSLNSQLLEVLGNEAQQAQRRQRMKKAIRKLDRLREEISKKFPVNYEMWELIREDRDTR
ncbi:MAG: Arc family DNA-binding protein [Terriglobia bacterium]|jgi:plasmid stability protein